MEEEKNNIKEEKGKKDSSPPDNGEDEFSFGDLFDEGREKKKSPFDDSDDDEVEREFGDGTIIWTASLEDQEIKIGRGVNYFFHVCLDEKDKEELHNFCLRRRERLRYHDSKGLMKLSKEAEELKLKFGCKDDNFFEKYLVLSEFYKFEKEFSVADIEELRKCKTSFEKAQNLPQENRDEIRKKLENLKSKFNCDRDKDGNEKFVRYLELSVGFKDYFKLKEALGT
jgi:hypothetical protein